MRITGMYRLMPPPLRLLFAVAFASVCLCVAHARIDPAVVGKHLDAERFDELESLYSKCLQEPFVISDWRTSFDDFIKGLTLDRKASEAAWQARLAKNEAWTAARPSSLIAAIALAAYHEQYAWKARGDGYASTVSPQAMALFHERIEKSLGILRAIPAGRQQDFSYHLAIADALFASAETANEGFEHLLTAIKLQPAYPEAYQTGALFLLPRWYGQPGTAESFARDMADRMAGDDGDMLYARLIGYIAYREEEKFAASCTPDLARTLRGYELLFKAAPGSRWGNLGRCTSVFAQLQEWPSVRRLILLAGPGLGYDAWNGWDNYRSWLDRSGAADELADIDRLESQGDLPAAEKRLLALAGQGDVNPWLSQFYLRHGMAGKYAAQPGSIPLNETVAASNLNRVADHACLHAAMRDFDKALPLASIFDARRGHNLIGKNILYSAALHSGNTDALTSARNAIASLKTSRPNYQLAVRFLRGEIPADENIVKQLVRDAYIGQAGFAIALHACEIGRPELARKVIRTVLDGPVAGNDYALLAGLLHHPPAP